MLWVLEYKYYNSRPYTAKKRPKMTVTILSKLILIKCISIKLLHAHLHYVHNKCAKFEKDPLKTFGGLDL